MINVRPLITLLFMGLIPTMNLHAADFSYRQNLPYQLHGEISAAAVEFIQEFMPDNNQVRLVNTYKDKFGHTFVRLQQYYADVLVDGSRILLHIDPDGAVYKIGGILWNDINVKNMDKAISHDKAGIIARSAAMTSKGRMRVSEMDTILPEEKLKDIHAEKPRMEIRGNRLVYRVVAHEKTEISGSFDYIIDAVTGELVGKVGTIIDLTPPSGNGYHTNVQGQFLQKEVNPDNNINTTSFLGWRDNIVGPNNYFLYRYSEPGSLRGGFGIINCHNSSFFLDWEWEQRASSDWSSSCLSMISAGNNLSIVQDWLTSFYGLYSVDNSGKLLTSHIDYREKDVPFNNAFWCTDDETFYFGDGDGVNYGHVCALDAVAHEIGHAVTQYSSNLEIGGEPRALNESYSDILAAAVEFSTQPPALNYPYTHPGQADWLIGEDITITKTALRDLRIGQREMLGGSLDDLSHAGASYYNGSRYWDNFETGGWNNYQASQVQSFAFYLLSEGVASVYLNDGHPYGPFGGIGIEAATKIAMYANIVETNSTHACLIDSRAAWVRAAEYLVGQSEVPAGSVSLVNQVWDAVGVLPGVSFRIVYQDWPRLAIDNGVGNMKLMGWCAQGNANVGTGKMVFKNSETSLASLEKDYAGQDRTLNIQGTLSQDIGGNFGGLTGKLVIRGPDGNVHMTLDQSGNLNVREKERRGVLF